MVSILLEYLFVKKHKSKMLKIEDLKNQIQKSKSELTEVNSKLNEEEKKYEELMTEVKNEYNAKTKKIKDAYSNKTKTLESKKISIEASNKNMMGDIYMSYVDKKITQDELDELTALIKG